MKAHSPFKWGLIILTLTLPFLIWILIDEGIRGGDHLLYRVLALRLYDNLIHDLHSHLTVCMQIMPPKAPLLWWLGQFFVPIGKLFGKVEDVLLISNVIYTGLAVYLVALSVQKLFRQTLLTLMAILIILGMPLVFRLTTEFWTEPLQLLTVASFLFLATHNEHLTRIRMALILVLLCAFAALVKTSMPLYLLGLAPLLLADFFRKGRSTGRVLDNKLLILASVTLLYLSIWFYTLNFTNLWEFAKHASSSEIYGVSGVSRLDIYIYWFANMFYNNLLIWLSMIVFIPLAVIRGRMPLLQNRNGVLFVLAAAQLLFCLLLYGSSNNLDIRFLMPLAPYVVIVITYLIHTMICSPTQQRIVLAICFIQYALIMSAQFRVVNYHGLVAASTPRVNEGLRMAAYDGILQVNRIIPASKSEKRKVIRKVIQNLDYRDGEKVLFQSLPTFQADHVAYELMIMGKGKPDDVSHFSNIEHYCDMYTLDHDGALDQSDFVNDIKAMNVDCFVVENPDIRQTIGHDTETGWYRIVISCAYATVDSIMASGKYNIDTLKGGDYFILRK